ncbi:MAG: malto-oligosyltrehalose trehalohydrolase [Candidatus Omnitrophota bacterium]
MQIGAKYIGKGKCEFVVWAPLVTKVNLNIVYPALRKIPMQKDNHGYWRVELNDVTEDTRYFYVLENSRERPDPASFFQPRGVHAGSQIVNHRVFKWQDDKWQGIYQEKMIIYELHIGVFTEQGDFDAVIERLDDLIELGVNTIELMPVAQFPGDRNWGYDGAYLFAVQNSYGGPDGLKRLVNACHNKGLSVLLDVVYNHLGPEGNYLSDFAPYFTYKYKTPWGRAVNFDDDYNEGVRNFFIENALYWFKNYHIDGLRLDAIHGIFDNSQKHILKELSEKVDEFSAQEGRKFYLIAESDLNDSTVIRAKDAGGYGIDAQWCDDFHHCIHTLVTGEDTGYYVDYGKASDLVKSFKEGFVYSGQYSEFRKKAHGNSSADIPAGCFVVFSQNHDQVGNRGNGERLSVLTDFDSLKLSAATVFFSSYIPLLFMGEEYGEDNPFLYFVSHSDEGLIEAVRQGRKNEFKSFGWEQQPPDPQSEETFSASKLKWDKRRQGKHKVLFDFYRQLINMRKTIPSLANLDKKNQEVIGLEDKKIIILYRWFAKSKICCIMNYNINEVLLALPPNPLPIGERAKGEGQWNKLIDSSDPKWSGSGISMPERISQGKKLIMKPRSVVLYEKEIL